MILTDIEEVKRVLELDPDDHSEDAKLQFFIEWASGIIEEYLDREDLSYQLRTEYYDGSGTAKLLLRHRPVHDPSSILVYTDENGFYGSPENAFAADSQNPLVYGVDFCLRLLQTGKASRSGILVRINGYWPRPSVRQRGLLAPFMGPSFGNVKVIYSAGYKVDDLPSPIRMACNDVVGKMRNLWPLGMPIGSESYEERSVSYMMGGFRNYLLGMAKSYLFTRRNWRM